MKKIMKIKNEGFSLIELMVVVAIIAILASFAIPQYQSFQARARQKEGLTLLNSYYVAAKATEAEMGVLPGNFVGIGFNPAGQIHYRIVSANGVVPPYGPNNTTCVSTALNCGINYTSWNEVNGGNSSFGVMAASGCAAATNSTAFTFLTCASARIRPQGTVDTWSINQLKVLNNNSVGM